VAVVVGSLVVGVVAEIVDVLPEGEAVSALDVAEAVVVKGGSVAPPGAPDVHAANTASAATAGRADRRVTDVLLTMG
jgi:hypothetical protein